MTNKTLQYLIYNRLYSASMYELLATQAPTNILQTQMKLYQEETLNNVSYLDRYYQELNTSSYHPIVKSLLIKEVLKKYILDVRVWKDQARKYFAVKVLTRITTNK